MQDTRKTTTEAGNIFRDAVFDLLSLSVNILELQREIQLAHQDVDIYYEEQTSTGVLRVACECKAYATPLTQSDLQAIWSKYHPLISGSDRVVDRVRVFAPFPLGANADAYRRQVGFAFSTLDEVETSIIDFSIYLHSISRSYADDLGELYIPLRFKDGSSAEERIEDWIHGSAHRPMAVLAGYGMGKTSLARHVAASLAQAKGATGGRRIPILIPLSEISSQQSLEGLLGKLFSAQYRVANYSYDLFMELNRRGRLLIILDGFDEMKHAITWAEFQYNVSQLHQLVVPNARVLLLGRPSALTSESEERWVLRGLRRVGDHEEEVPGAPDYITESLAELQRDQALEMIDKYTTRAAARRMALRGIAADQRQISSRLEDIRTNAELGELMLRPVQARMISELIAGGSQVWPPSSRYELYEAFVFRLLERETEKSTRQRISNSRRLSFHQDLAWWIWESRRAGSFRADEVPRDFYKTVKSENPDLENEQLVRELLTGSLLDKKLGDTFYFPHRSFLEFLAARWAINAAPLPQTVSEISTSFTSELADFIGESNRSAVVDAWDSVLDQLHHPTPLKFIEFLANNRHGRGISVEPSIPLTIGVRGLIRYWLLARLELDATEAFNRIGRFASVNQVADRAVSLGTAAIMATMAGESEGALRRAMGGQVATVILNRCMSEIVRVTSSKVSGGARVALNVSDPWVATFVSTFSLLDSTEIAFAISPSEVREQLVRHADSAPLKEILNVNVIGAPIEVTFSSLQTWSRELAPSRQGGKIAQFVRMFPDLTRFAKVRTER